VKKIIKHDMNNGERTIIKISERSRKNMSFVINQTKL